MSNVNTVVSPTYEGWKNYETWSVSLLIRNEQSDQDHWHENARECYRQARNDQSADKYFTIQEHATFALESLLNSEFSDSMPDVEGFWSSLLHSAFERVSWREIAKSLMSEIDVDALDLESAEEEEEEEEEEGI